MSHHEYSGEEEKQQPQEEGQQQGEDLQARIEEKEQENQELRDKLLRVRADFENYRKQVERNTEELVRRVSDQEVLDLVEVYDSMEAAFRAYRRLEDAQAFVEGMERIFAQLAEMLERKGCRSFCAQGDKFDPTRHEVLIATESPEERDTILEEFERGWCRGERVLRTSKVKASLGPEHKTGGDTHGGNEGKSNRD